MELPSQRSAPGGSASPSASKTRPSYGSSIAARATPTAADAAPSATRHASAQPGSRRRRRGARAGRCGPKRGDARGQVGGRDGGIPADDRRRARARLRPLVAVVHHEEPRTERVEHQGDGLRRGHPAEADDDVGGMGVEPAPGAHEEVAPVEDARPVVGAVAQPGERVGEDGRVQGVREAR